MSNMINFANRHLCEYASIFPNVAALLGHLLFVIGNGYDIRKGMLYSSAGRIDSYPAMTDEEWNKLIADCHAKERKWAEDFARGRPINEEHLALDCSMYQRQNVTDADFTVEALGRQIRETGTARDSKYKYESYYRPYPLCNYSYIFHLDKKTPAWLLQIGYNLCVAWVDFLNEEIATDHVWKPRSQRPVVELTEAQKIVAEAMQELAASIKEGDGYDGWLDKTEEKTSDYGDLTWTTKHRDMLAAEVARIGALLNVHQV